MYDDATQQRLDEARRKDQERQQPGNAEDRYNNALESDRKHQQPSGVVGAANNAKNLAKAATPMGAFSVLKQIDLLKDMPFICAFGFALLKDILDLVFAETVILSILSSILCSIFIFMMLMLAGSSGKRKGAQSIIKKVVPLVGGGVMDSIPGLDFLPIETVTVGIIYFMALSERANAGK